ncbi:hypothetical protein SAMN05216410_2913 [Sanguibacter gelidistatuariae]|uniref:Uncharacterized protein n=1 Tax=Sanguibacter gelidistatuariae TaxID=1814289 RepID=A0A1G6S9W3_9MICO|nr:hypothetical protein [Sanguibacter gelidistatuariae]SDD13629.1 hypothetical protein SAMN05216410_2913 [Sanguibacter gelidistatuariae]
MTTPTTTSADGLAFARYADAEPGVGDAALLTGVVHDSDGCLTVQDPVTGGTVTPILPSSVEQAESLKEGDTVELRGGATDEPFAYADIPDMCASSGQFWLVVAHA